MNSPSSHEQKHRRVKSLEQTGRQSTQSDAKTKELSRKKNYSYLPSNLPSVVHDKRYLDKRKTINAFLKKRDFDLIMGTVDSSKKKAVIISKHASVEQVSSQAKHNMQSYVNFKQKQGQMFTHELWSGAHYSKMLKLSGLAQRKQDVHLENELKSTEEKLKELDILFQKLNSKVPIVPEAMKLINHAKERANELEIRPFEPLSSYKQFKLQKRPISPQNQVTLIQSTETDLKRTVLSKGEAKSPESPRLRGKMMNHLAATLSNSSSLTNVQSCLHSGYTSKSQSPLLPRKPQTQRGINSSIPFPTDSAQENWKNQQQITSKIRSSSESAFQNTLNLHNNQHIVREKRYLNIKPSSLEFVSTGKEIYGWTQSSAQKRNPREMCSVQDFMPKLQEQTHKLTCLQLTSILQCCNIFK